VTVWRQDFGKSSQGGELKNWKPEKLTVCTPDQIPRISEIQVFTRQTYPEFCRLARGGMGLGNIGGD
jgi:hypothetical protein